LVIRFGPIVPGPGTDDGDWILWPAIKPKPEVDDAAAAQ
jgi:hypothetical protein